MATAENLQVANMPAQQLAAMDTLVQKGRGVLLACVMTIGGLGLAGCASGGSANSLSRSAETATTAPPITTGPCADIAQFSLNLADHDVAPNPNAYLPALYTVAKNGDESLVSSSKASELLRKQVCGDRRVLAVLSAVQSLWQNEQLPSPALKTEISDLFKLYSEDPSAAEKAEQQVYPWLSTLVATTEFAITKDQATAVVAQRQNGILDSFGAETLTSEGSLSGFRISYIADNENLTDTQRALFDKLQQLVLVDKNGYIVFNDLLGGGTIPLAQELGGGSGGVTGGGNVREKNKGNSQGNSSNGIGKKPESGKPGSHPSPSGGGPGPTTTTFPGGTTTTTAPGETTTTTAPPNTTTTTAPPNTTTTTAPPNTTTTTIPTRHFYPPEIIPPSPLIEPLDEGDSIEVCETVSTNPAGDPVTVTASVEAGSITTPQNDGNGEYCETFTAPDKAMSDDRATFTVTDNAPGNGQEAVAYWDPAIVKPS